MKKIQLFSIAILLTAVIFYLEITGTFSLGKIINHYFPCKQDPANSFPCYGVYDIYLMLVLAGIFVILALTVIYQIYQIITHHHTCDDLNEKNQK